MKKSVLFLYINNEKSAKEITKTIPFTISPERIRYLNKLTMAVKKLTENYNILLKEMKTQINNSFYIYAGDYYVPCTVLPQFSITSVKINKIKLTF